MKNLKQALSELISDLLLAAGGAAVAVGAGLIYPPAGLIVGGLLVIAGVALSARGGDGA